MVLGVALAVVIGGGAIAYNVFKPATATSTVQQYFADLAHGDTLAALKLVDGEFRDSEADYPFLVPKALSDEHTRPSDLRVLHTESTTGFNGQTVEIVQVSYRIRGNAVTQAIAVRKTQDGDPAYLLHEPFLQLSVTSLAGRRLTVNGITANVGAENVDSEDGTYVFPGAYTATAQGDALIAGATQAAVVRSGDFGDMPVAGIDFGTPTLAQGAQQAVEAKVRQQIDTCAQSTNAEPSDCPFSVFIFAQDVSVQWSITNYPTISVALSSDPSADQQVDIGTDTDDGVAHYVANYTDDFTGKKQTEAGDQNFGVQGTATASGSEITVSIS